MSVCMPDKMNKSGTVKKKGKKKNKEDIVAGENLFYGQIDLVFLIIRL